ncbi:bifunctional adenosylcobinamide kinase/adenosylcobinamide-phosphate guanylyltransferase [Roseovarius sp. MBR-78]|uniref:bifunctional adenosylcobinamide kinase/adenosylcobinamide-phosphate guanylyltransferase n=1 Tax=Roseovarius sp. MBR-78 TaxID=3156460 RepID=UPI00339B40F4
MRLMLSRLTLVLGGAASGKSAFAEGLVRRTGLAPVYLATARAHDDEMRAKLRQHRARRDAAWRTVEAPRDLGPALGSVTAGEVVLLDCATMWLSNHMLAGSDLAGTEAALMAALDACAAPVVVVSNEVGLSVVPENALARAFQRAQGELNQRLAARAGLVVNVIAGLPQVLKGALP